MLNDEVKRLVEAALFMASRPVTLEELSDALGVGNLSKIRSMVLELEEEYRKRGSGIVIYINEDKRTYYMHISSDLEKG